MTTFEPLSLPPAAVNGTYLQQAIRPTIVRSASLADLDTILEICLSAMPSDPQWDYRFPLRRRFPADMLFHTAKRYREFLEDSSGQWYVTVAEFHSAAARTNPPAIVAFAVWNVANVAAKQTKEPSSEQRRLSTYKPPIDSPTQSAFHPRRDGNSERMLAWKKTLKSEKSRLFDETLGETHFQLQILATHPKSQRRGAASELCRHGMHMADLMGMSISVFASPIGKRLYRHLGFQYLSTVVIKTPDEEASVSVEAMVYTPNSWISATL